LYPAIVLCLLAPGISHAHGAGITFSDEVNGYQVDVDYESPSILAGIPGRFVFNLYTDPERTKNADFTDLWVRVLEKVEGRAITLFAGPIFNPEFVGAGFLYTFHEGGDYQLSVRYMNGEEVLAESILDIPVENDPDEKAIFLNLEFWAGALGAVLVASLLGGAGYVYRRRKNALT